MAIRPRLRGPRRDDPRRDDPRPARTVEVVLGAGPGDAADPDDLSEPGSRAHRDAAFTAFVAEHSATLLRTAWFLVGDRHRAEELVQHALVRTYASWERAEATDPLGYARRVLVNLRTDTWRRRRREVVTDPVELPEAVTADATRLLDDRDELVRALAALPDRQRTVVVLRHMAGLTEAEVARELGVSTGTVKSTASRGLAALRLALGVAAPARPAVGSAPPSGPGARPDEPRPPSGPGARPDDTTTGGAR